MPQQDQNALNPMRDLSYQKSGTAINGEILFVPRSRHSALCTLFDWHDLCEATLDNRRQVFCPQRKRRALFFLI